VANVPPSNSKPVTNNASTNNQTPMAQFTPAYEIGKANEGGYVNDPKDSGGETYKGIARKFHGDWPCWAAIDAAGEMHGKGTRAFVGALEIDSHVQNMVIAFYRAKFWKPLMGDQLPSQAIANELYDTAINQGVGQAVKFLQQSLNLLNDGGALYADIEVDGQMGPGTLRALNTYFGTRPTQRVDAKEKVLLKALNGFQFQRYVTVTPGEDHKNERFFYGWLNTRIAMMLVLVGFTAAFGGCRSLKDSSTEATVTNAATTDSVMYREKLVPYLVEVPGEVVFTELDNPCDSLGNLKPLETAVKGKRNATVTVTTKNNKLRVSGGCDVYRDSVLVLNTQLERYRNNATSTVRTKETIKQVKYTPKWLRFQWLLLYAAAIYMAGHFRLVTKAFRLIVKLSTGI
jgi:lysozyme family protein